jgi:hydrogenase maturation factor
MNRADHVGTREYEQLVAALLAPEVLRGKVVLLHTGAHRAVIDEHAPL